MNLREKYAEISRLEDEVEAEAQALFDSIPDELLFDTQTGHELHRGEERRKSLTYFNDGNDYVTSRPSLRIEFQWSDGDYMGSMYIPHEEIEAGHMLDYLTEKRAAFMRVQAAKDEARAQEREETDRQEYARLKEKYG